MKNKTRYEQIQTLIKALAKDIKPIREKAEALRKVRQQKRNFNNNSSIIKLMNKLTKTSRRHDLDKKVRLPNYRNEIQEYKVGTNHNGLGYVGDWGTQLQSLTDVGYDGYEQKIIRIIEDEEAVLELTTIIKKCYQKDFLKAVNIIKKQKRLEEKEEETKEEITIKLEKGEAEKIILDISRHNIEVTIQDKKGNIINDTITELAREDNRLKEEEILNSRIELREIKLLEIIIENKEKIIFELEKETENIKKIIEKREVKEEEINNILRPLEALEQI